METIKNKIIQYEKITPPTMELYSPDDVFIGIINEYEFLDFRVKIKEEGVFGYYVIFKGTKVRLDKKGELDVYPDGLLDTMTSFYMKLF